MLRNDLPEIKEGLKLRIVEVCAALLPKGRREGRLWVAHNPFINEGKKVPALKVALNNDRGAWKDWRNGDQGDVLQLIEFCLNCNLPQALDWARDFLGFRQMTMDQRNDLRSKLLQRQKTEIEEQARLRAEKIKRGQSTFLDHTFELGANSPAELHARAYFAARNCPLEQIINLNRRTFRFSSETEWWRGQEWKSENNRHVKVKAGPLFPAIHSAMRVASGAVSCCHVTFLDVIEPAKAKVTPNKMFQGEALGAVIELTTGLDDLPFWHGDAKPGPVIICEGIETGLSIAIAVPEARVWAAGSLAAIGHAPVHLACVKDIVVARDNNEGNPQAQGQLAKGLERLQKAEKPLVVMASHVGDDFNDLTTED